MTILSFNPYNNEKIGEYEETSVENLDLILKKSINSRKDWSKLDFQSRARILSELSLLITTDLDNLVRDIVLETGMPISEARSSTTKLVDRINFLCEMSPEYLNPEVFDLKDGRLNQVHYTPVGSVGCIMPWNHPFIIPFWSIVPALIGGNSIIYKPSELTPKVGELVNNLFTNLDLPEGLFQVIYGDGKLGREIASSSLIDMISFAGSVGVGKNIFQECSNNMKRMILENGGKDSLIIGEYSDKEKLANQVLQGAFRHSGQLCSSVRRVYILESELSEYLDLLNTNVSNYVIGNPLDEDTFIGPLKTRRQIEALQDKIEEATNKGAKILFGNKTCGNIFYPTILYDATENMEVVTEEVFGPLLPIIPVRTISEAITQTNNSIFGLNASIWHDDVSQAINYARNIEVGTVTINSLPGTHNYCTWHGIKMSGVGNILSKEGVLQFTNRRNIRFML